MSTNLRVSALDEAMAALQRGDGLRGAQVSRLTGITYRQLDYWDRNGILRPSLSAARGSGTQRRYSIEDVRIIGIMRRALDAGVSLQKIRQAIPLIRDGDGCRWLLLGPEVVVCADGELERLCDEAKVCTVIDMESEVVPVVS